MVHLNLLAAVLFGILSLFYFFDQRLFFGVVWLAIAAFWVRRFWWARTSPFLEIAGGSLVMHLGPGRRRELPLAEVKGIDASEAKVEVTLHDDTSFTFSKSDLGAGELPRFAAALEEERRRGGGDSAVADVSAEDDPG
jgi:hypothetical protein